jgi:hypothetical protein
MRIGTLGQQNLEGGIRSLAAVYVGVKVASANGGASVKMDARILPLFHYDTPAPTLCSFGTHRNFLPTAHYH